jgi:hypothetical protein
MKYKKDTAIKRILSSIYNFNNIYKVNAVDIH